MNKQKNNAATRKRLEDEGQMTIFDMIESGIDPEKVVAQADAELDKLKENSPEMADNPIGLRTEGNNMDIDEMIQKEEPTAPEITDSADYDPEFLDMVADHIAPSELKAMVEESAEPELQKEDYEAGLEVEKVSPELEAILEDHVSAEELSAILNEGFEKEQEPEVSEPTDYTNYSLDEFAGSEPDFDDRLIAFDTSLPTDDPKFITAAAKEDFSSIAEFKAAFSGQGGLNEHLIMAFPLKADAEPERVVAMYEKKLANAQKVDIKDADKEAKKIAALEASGDVTEEVSDAEPEQPKKRGRKRKI